MLGRGAIAICAIFAVAFLFFGMDQKGSSVPRVKVAIKTTIDGTPTSAEWIMPAVWHWDFFRPAPGFRRIQSPFDTVYLRLPGGEGLGVTYEVLSDLLRYPQDWPRMIYHVLDSLDEPRVMIGYAGPAQNGRDCPTGQPILDCKVTGQVEQIEDGPIEVAKIRAGGNLHARGGPARYEEIRQFGWSLPKPMLFGAMGGTLLQSSGFRSDPLFGPIVGNLAGPRIVGIDYETWKRFWALPGSRLRGGLTYCGGNTWRLAEPLDRDSEFFGSLGKSYRLTLVDAADVVGFGSIRRERRHLIAGTIEYRGELIEYDPVDPIEDRPENVYSLALVDPERDIVIVLSSGPTISVIWKVNP